MHIISVLYLPLTILANTVLFEHSKLLPAALVHIGCGWSKEALNGSKYLSDDIVGELHSAARRCCQYSVTLAFTSFLNLFLATGFSSNTSGWGRLY